MSMIAGLVGFLCFGVAGMVLSYIACLCVFLIFKQIKR
jgi:hypothetical protein